MEREASQSELTNADENERHADDWTDHACARVLPDEGVSEDLREFTGSERCVGLVPAQRPDALLVDGRGERGEGERERETERQRSASSQPGERGCNKSNKP